MANKYGVDMFCEEGIENAAYDIAAALFPDHMAARCSARDKILKYAPCLLRTAERAARAWFRDQDERKRAEEIATVEAAASAPPDTYDTVTSLHCTACTAPIVTQGDKLLCGRCRRAFHLAEVTA